eukprot:TRINITY_DN3115_c0_g1_i4.p1 TRINITY_DN3115_c0_g1~~TRINITY_DN3115_c0_g1_i4.p1  ORF type:complete len:592 (-),score=144.81 TRINITY_DN3115_c0_g1_i4:216-1991(-)
MSVIWRVIKELKPTYPQLLLGIFMSCCNGAVFPCFAFAFSEMMGVLVGWSGDSEYKQKVLTWTMFFVALGVGSFLVWLLQLSMLTYSSEVLTVSLRHASFNALTRQDIAWFDNADNSVGVLTTKLSSEATLVNGVVGSVVSIVANAVTSLVIGVVIALVGCWQVALVVIAMLPIFSSASFIRKRNVARTAARMKRWYEKSGQVASQAIDAIRTVAMIGREPTFLDLYMSHVIPPERTSLRVALGNALCTAISGSSSYCMNAVAFGYGSWLVNRGAADFAGVMKAEMGVMFGALTFTSMFAYMPDYVKAKLAAHHIFTIIDRVPPIDSEIKTGIMLSPSEVAGEIVFKGVKFEYPSRPGTVVLNDFSLKIKPGKTIALVGPSGCGKSTTISLLQRFYDPIGGTILLDGRDITSFNLQWLRAQMGLVSQEPVLFGATIRENIARGATSPAHATTEAITNAAKAANAHNFICMLPDGYQTEVGEKGTQLSGGQKQRVAIARALVRNPRILLLDEATSALDTESESIVQEALDRARKGRTTIVIAHRLSTVQTADKIVVIQGGKVAEIGKHAQLMALKGVYYQLASNQLAFQAAQ